MTMLVRKGQTATRLVIRALRRRLIPLARWSGGRRPRVLMLSDAEGATLQYRVLNQAEQLRMAGIDVCCCDQHYIRLFALLDSCDLLYFYRLDDTPRTRHILDVARTRGLTIVCDTDDLTWDERIVEDCQMERYYTPPEITRFRTQFRRSDAFLRNADLFVASTEYLAGLLREHFERPAFVNQNAISPHMVALSEPFFARRMAAPDRAPLTIAYFSGWPKAHEIDIDTMVPGLRRALEELPDARLLIVGHFDTTMLPVDLQRRVERRPFVPYHDLFAAIAEADINLAPLVDNPHRRSKSAVKFLEAALVGVPTVASDLEPYRLIQHGQTGMLTMNAQDWYAGIMALATDAARRVAIGRAAHEYVLREHTSVVRAAGFAKIVDSMIEQQ
ncbi:MAG: glycosyltransferase [Roseiflexaceae bacterium]|nr:glycosyltransferase [Roseiflexaceae bacterium]